MNNHVEVIHELEAKLKELYHVRSLIKCDFDAHLADLKVKLMDDYDFDEDNLVEIIERRLANLKRVSSDISKITSKIDSYQAVIEAIRKHQ